MIEIESTINVLLDDLNDLSLWSVYNQDKYADMISTIKEALETIKKNEVVDHTNDVQETAESEEHEQ